MIGRAVWRYLRSPYLLLWRTVELLVAFEVASEHGIDLVQGLDLDVGCGDGIVGAILSRRIRLGIDPQARSLRWARREPTYRALAAATGARLPVASGALRLVFSNSVLEHIPEDDAVLGEMARVLAPGGHLLLTLAAANLPDLALHGDAAEERRTFDASLQHVHYYSPASIGTQLAGHGLRVLATRAYLDGADIQRWYRLRRWEGRHARHGLRRYAHQLSRVPASLTLLPRLAAGPGHPACGGGLAVLARKEAP